MLNIREMERRIVERRDEIENDIRQEAMIRQLKADDECVRFFRPQRRLRCQVGLALVRLGTRLAA